MLFPIFSFAEKIQHEDMVFEILPEGGAVLLEVQGQGSDMFLPDEVQGQPVIALSESLLQDRENLLYLRLPRFLQRIEAKAFAGASSLTSIVFPSSLEYIGAYAFADCASLSEVTFLGENLEIGDYAFSACSNLAEIRFPANMQRVPDGLMKGASSLQKLELGDAVESIGKEAFFAAFQLTEVRWPKKLKEIGEFAFASTGLQSFDPKNQLLRIEKAAFQDCLELGIVSLQEGLVYIGQSAFGGCVSLETCIFPFSLNTVSPDSFVHTPSLNKLYVPQNSVAERWAQREGRATQTLYRDASKDYYYSISYKNTATLLRYLGDKRCLMVPASLDNYPIEAIASYAFYNLPEISSVILPDGIEIIGQNAFSHCDNMVEIRLGEGLRVIDSEAFYDCSSLVNVNLPNSLQYIGEFAFFNCPVENFIVEQGSFGAQWVERMGFGISHPSASLE